MASASAGRMAYPGAKLGTVIAEMFQYEAHCACGAVWNLELAEEPFTLECLNCGATVVDIREIGIVHRWRA